jgi:hypothetical protein
MKKEMIEMREYLMETFSKMSTSEVKELIEELDKLEEIRKNKKIATPSDDDFLAALGPCGK